MESVKTTVTERGTVIIESSSGKKHEGYVDVRLAGEEVEIMKFNKDFVAFHNSMMRNIVTYVGQDKEAKKQLDLFE